MLLETPIEAVDEMGVLARGKRIDRGKCHLVRRCRGIAGGALAQRAGRQGRTGQSRSRPVGARPPRDLHRRRCRVRDRCEGRAAAGSSAGRPTAGSVCRRVDRSSCARRAGAAPFRYRDKGALATIGRHSAIADLGWIRLTGWVASILWGIVHIFFLIGFRNRMAVFLNWIWAWLTYGRGARLITGDTTPLALPAKPAPPAIPAESGSEGTPDGRLGTPAKAMPMADMAPGLHRDEENGGAQISSEGKHKPTGRVRSSSAVASVRV